MKFPRTGPEVSCKTMKTIGFVESFTVIKRYIRLLPFPYLSQNYTPFSCVYIPSTELNNQEPLW